MSTSDMNVWDPFVRLFHWSLVSAFAVSYLSEGEVMPLHAWSGYVITALVLLRILWGLVGSRHARFRDFVRGPRAVLAHLRALVAGRPPRHRGHNPAGGAMILALLAALFATCLLGMALWAVDEGAGPLAPWLAGGGHALEELLEEAHEIAANLTLGLVLLHVGGVLLESWLLRENLVRAMVTGRKAGGTRHDD